ncbi:MAG: cell cycle transcriptional regulator TrcR [Janthinobacterium lividum]
MNQNKKLPLLPKATAIWLIDKTTLTFKQIAEFCGIHELEVKGIADGEVSSGILGLDPISGGQLTKEEIERCSKDPEACLKLSASIVYEIKSTKKKLSRYTPIALREDKPKAIYWLLKAYPEILDSQIIKLVGTTKPTIRAIRERDHWNMKNLTPKDPVLLGLCTQVQLDEVMEKVQLLTSMNTQRRTQE